MKYIEILFKVQLIDKDTFNEIKYGTSNEIQIYLQKEGLSQELSKKIVNEYNEFITIDKEDDYHIGESILQEFSENEILKTELQYYL